MASVTILIPNRNEPDLAETITGLLDLKVEILIADDLEGRGIGWAIRDGLELVTTRWVIIAMADGSEHPECLSMMIDAIDERSLAVWGDRWDRGYTFGYPRVKRLFNRVGNYLIAYLSGRQIPYFDWTDLAKAYRTDYLRTITWSDDFRCEVEIPLRYHQRFIATAECPPVVPMIWRERTRGESAYRVKHAWGSLLALGKVLLYG